MRNGRAQSEPFTLHLVCRNIVANRFGCGASDFWPGPLWPVIHTVYYSLNTTLEGRRVRCFYSHMSTVVIEIRRAKPSDAKSVAETHDEAWRTAYQGIIPGNELDKLISRRGPDWWDSRDPQRQPHHPPAVRRQHCGLCQLRPQPRAQPVLRRRDLRALSAPGISGPRLRPPPVHRRAQGPAAKRTEELVVWALSDNEPAVEFYRALGGRAVARSSERFGDKTLDKVAYAWQA